jgi:hypothetical protein
MVPTQHDDSGDSHSTLHQLAVVDSVPVQPAAAVEPVKAQKPKSIPSRAMSSDLQAKMNRRRQMVETMSSETAPTAALLNTTTTPTGLSHTKARSPFHRLKTVGMASDLQIIMARRKRMADDDNN